MNSERRFGLFCLVALGVLLTGCSVVNEDAPDPYTDAIIADHTSIDLNSIPEEWILQAKETLHIAYGHSSHGSQLTTGMTGLAEWKGSLYSWNFGGVDGALDIRDYYYDFGDLGIANDLGSTADWTLDRTAWERATRIYLSQNPDINVIIWAWCWQMDTSDPDNIQLYYLDLMDGLERDFPNVKFIYMTGHVNGTEWGEGDDWDHVHYMRWKQILDYCVTNNKILYDFSDIESWDPSGNWYGDKLVDDACDYDSNSDGVRDRNWAIDWQNAHPGEWYVCDAAHTQPLNANLKAYAAWWLWARLAGWDGN